MDNVINLFGDRVEEVQETISSKEVLSKCAEHDFESVLVIGLKDGLMGFSTNLDNAPQVTYLIEKFKFSLMSNS